jgi:hypothetical protein
LGTVWVKLGSDDFKDVLLAVVAVVGVPLADATVIAEVLDPLTVAPELKLLATISASADVRLRKKL